MFIRQILLITALCLSGTLYAKPQPLVSIAPLAMLVKALLPSVDSVQILIPTEQNLHDYALRVEDIKTLQQALFFVYLGGKNEAFLDKLHSRLAQQNWHALAPDSDHIWLDSNKLPALIERLAQVLIVYYPQQHSTILQNSQTLKQALSVWQMQWQTKFAPFQQTPFLLGHDAFYVFAKNFGLQAAVFYRAETGHGHQQDGIQTLIQVQQQIQQAKIRCAIEEPDVSFHALKKRYATLKIITLSANGTTVAIDADSFLAFLQHNAEMLYQCLQA